MADYRSAKTYRSSVDAAAAVYGTKQSLAWWAFEEEEARAASLSQCGLLLAQNSETRVQANIRHARLYENVDLVNLTGGSFVADTVRQALSGANIVSHNVVAACVDTLQAKIAKNKPRPMFITSGGNWKQQQKARRLDTFMRGLFYEVKLYEKAQRVFTDGAVYGTGILQLFQNDDGRLDCERVSIDEIFVDEVDGADMQPRMIIRRKYVQRAVLCDMFPDYADEIMAAPSPQSLRSGSSMSTVATSAAADVVEVWEGWHRRSGKTANDGWHSIVLGNCELFGEKWTLDCLPFVFFRCKNRLRGMWGKGVSESLTGIQIEVNRTIRSIAEQIRRRGKGRIFVPIGSKVNPNHLTNGVGDIVSFSGGVPPIVDSSNAVAQEEFAYLQHCLQQAFREYGISELSAAAKKPSGLDAAVALREYSDIESERFAIIHQMWEQFFLNFSEVALEMIANQYGPGGYKMRTPSRRFVIEVDWKDIKLDQDSYVMQMFPVSALPQTPAARYQKVREMMQDGFIDRPTAQRLMDFPDIEAEGNLGNAAIDDVDATISAILDEATPVLYPIEPYQNVSLLAARAQAAYLHARHHGAEEERLDMLRQLVDSALATMIPPNQPPQMPGPAMMPGMGAPLPPAPPGAGPAIPPPVPGEMSGGMPQQ